MPRIAPGVAEPQGQRARVDLVERDDAALGEPERPVLAAEAAHEDGARVRRLGLEPRVRHAVVADHRRREAHELRPRSSGR